MNQNSHDTSKPGSGRRRFLGAGVAATPALLTLVSQPALGASVTCFTPSRALSRNTSVSQAAKNGSCDGRSPGYWKTTSETNWPVPQATLFHSVFSGGRFKVNSVSETMLQVLNRDGNGDTEKMGFHVIGAYLNLLKGLVNIPSFTVNELKTIWTAWDSTGRYEVTAGVFWNATQIKAYFLSNQISP